MVFESPNRLPGLLRELAARWPDRPAAVLRELTKLHEEALRGTLAELAERLDAPPKGEVVLVLGAAPAAAPGDEDAGRLREALGHMLDAGMGAGRAADLAAALGLARRNAAYRAAVEEAERRRSAT